MFLFVYTSISLVSIFFVVKRKINVSLSRLIFLAFIIRLVVLLIFSESSSDDINTFLRDGNYLINRDRRYDASYFPFVSYLGAAALYLKNFIDPYFFLKVIFSLFDGAILYPLYYLAKKNSQSALIYALNPVSIIISNIHGQIDSLPMFCLLMGILLYMRKRLFASILIISAGIYIKTWPLLFVVPLFKRAKNKLLFILLPLIPVAFTAVHTIFFESSFVEIISKVKNHRGIFGAWGLSKILLYLSGYSLGATFEGLMRRIFVLAFIIFSFFRNDKNILKAILMTMLFFFIFTPTFGLQWFSWLVPFVLIVKPALWKTFLVVGSVYVTVGFVWDADVFFKQIMPVWNAVITRVGFAAWIFMIYMFFKNLKSSE